MDGYRMNVKLKILVIALCLASRTTAKIQLDKDVDKLNSSEEYSTTVDCQHNSKCFTEYDTDTPDSMPSTKEDIKIIKHKDLSDEILSILKLLKLVTLKDERGNKGSTKITLNVRDIQNGFTNTGKKYHIGNVHREFKRSKREVNDIKKSDTDDNPVTLETGYKGRITNKSPVNLLSNSQVTTIRAITNFNNEDSKHTTTATEIFVAISAHNNLSTEITTNEPVNIDLQNVTSVSFNLPNSKIYAFGEMGVLLNSENQQHLTNEQLHNHTEITTELSERTTAKSSILSNDTITETNLENLESTTNLNGNDNKEDLVDKENTGYPFKIDVEEKSIQKNNFKDDSLISAYTDIIDQHVKTFTGRSDLDVKEDFSHAQKKRNIDNDRYIPTVFDNVQTRRFLMNAIVNNISQLLKINPLFQNTHNGDKNLVSISNSIKINRSNEPSNEGYEK